MYGYLYCIGTCYCYYKILLNVYLCVTVPVKMHLG